MVFAHPDAFAYVYWENPGPDTYSLAPVAITSIPGPYFPGYRRLDVTVQNVSRRMLPKDYNFINLLVANENHSPQSTTISYGVGGAPSPSEAAAPNPALKPGATRKSSTTISVTPYPSGYTANVIYVAAWLVVSRRR